MIKWLNNPKLQLEPIYIGSKHGFKGKVFHSRCDNRGKTISVIKSKNNQIFGGYADKSWNKKGEYIEGQGKSFLFSFSKNSKHNCQDKQKEMFGCSNNNLMIFGGDLGPDLCIVDDCNLNTLSHSYLGYNYQMTGDLQNTEKNLAGLYKFQIIEIEVYLVKN